MAPKALPTGLQRLVEKTSLTAQMRRLAPRRLASVGARAGVIAIADQGVVSGVNFLTALLLARALPPTSYGQYVLIFAVLLFINGLQTALITAPLMVIAPRYDTQNSQDYINSLWVIQLGGCLLVGLLMIASMLLTQQYLPGLTYEIPVAPVVLVIISYLGQEFVRRVLFVQQHNITGFIVDLISYGLQFVSIIVFMLWSILTLPLVLWIIGITSLISCLFGLTRLGLSMTATNRTYIAVIWRQHWEQGQWLASSTLALWASNQIYFFVAAGVLSPAATAALGASRNLLGVTHIFLQGLENVVPAALTRRFLNGGIEAMVRWIRSFRLILAVFMGLYCVTIMIFADPLMHLLFGSQYAHSGTIVAIIAMSYFLIPFIRPPVTALRVMGQTRWIFYVYLISAVVTIIISIPIVQLIGVEGAAIGMVITQLIVAFAVNIVYRRVLKEVENNRISLSVEVLSARVPNVS
jgi:O-antigen/teichoic acid export membrane protein